MSKKYFKISNPKTSCKMLNGFIMCLFGDNSILNKDEIDDIVDELRTVKVSDEQSVQQNI